jgi:hypothetical protein
MFLHSLSLSLQGVSKEGIQLSAVHKLLRRHWERLVGPAAPDAVLNTSVLCNANFLNYTYSNSKVKAE